MRRKMTLTGTYVLAAALLLALGATARYSGGVSKEPEPARGTGRWDKE
jgi:hypothetical protein